MEEKKPKLCDVCKEKPAIFLCSECRARYCDKCSKFVHEFQKNRGHNLEIIPEGVSVNGKCPRHKGIPLDRFCVDEVELCCVECEREGFHKGHTVVKVADIARDCKVFSVSKAKSEFAQDMGKSGELIKRAEDAINTLRDKGKEMKAKIRQTFEDEHKKLDDEERSIMEKFEKVVNEHESGLAKCLNGMQKVYEHSELLNKARIGEDESSRVMALCVVSEMEKQQRRMEDFQRTEMADLEIKWDEEERELSFANHFFSGAPTPFNIRFPRVTGRDVGISWEFDEGKIREEDKAELRYVVEMKKMGEGKWQEVYSGKDRACTVAGLDMGTEYEVRVKTVVRKTTEWRWSENALVKTSDVPVPSNVRVKDNSWYSITFTWDAVGVATSYQVEVDGSDSLHKSTKNAFTMNELAPDTEHRIRVRAVCGKAVSEWSGVVKGRTLYDKYKCEWKECPFDVDWRRKYSVDAKNPRIASMTCIRSLNDYCTIIGNTPLPLNKVTSWSIKVLKSYNNDGGCIYIGVTPSNINQNEDYNFDKCGCYFDCYWSALYSGPPHDYMWPGKEYGPRKEKGQYVHTGDSVGVVMDTAKGELSFVLNGVNLGVAFKGVPLDKPLVPCVILRLSGDSVEFKASQNMKQKIIDRSSYFLDFLKERSPYLLNLLKDNEVTILEGLFALFVLVLIGLVFYQAVTSSWVGTIIFFFVLILICNAVGAHAAPDPYPRNNYIRRVY